VDKETVDLTSAVNVLMMMPKMRQLLDLVLERYKEGQLVLSTTEQHSCMANLSISYILGK
jgi:hypothetical protein